MARPIQRLAPFRTASTKNGERQKMGFIRFSRAELERAGERALVHRDGAVAEPLIRRPDEASDA
jgi:hypothetical protein